MILKSDHCEACGTKEKNDDRRMKNRNNNGVSRMVSDEIAAAIDVGTSKVCTIVGRNLGRDGVQVLGYSTVKNSGMRKGVVSDASEAERAVRASIEALEDRTGHQVDSAFVGVTGAHVRFENRHEKVRIENRKGIVTSEDVENAPKKLSEAVDIPGRTLIHANSISYTLDGESGIRHPVGMHSKEMQVETHFVTGSNGFVDSLVGVVEAAGVGIRNLALEPLASGLSVLTPEEREKGAVIVDIGAGTTDIVAFQRGSMYYTGVIPVGGYQFTNDIALTFNTSFETAEAIKLNHASADFQPASASEQILVPVIGRDKPLKVSRLEICQLARERAMELAHMIRVKLDSERGAECGDSVLVLTGGASNLPGLVPLVKNIVGLEVRHGAPELHGTVPAELRNPAYATSVGILHWGLTEWAAREVGFGARNGNGIVNGRDSKYTVESNGFFGSMKRRLAMLMP